MVKFHLNCLSGFSEEVASICGQTDWRTGDAPSHKLPELRSRWPKNWCLMVSAGAVAPQKRYLLFSQKLHIRSDEKWRQPSSPMMYWSLFMTWQKNRDLTGFAPQNMFLLSSPKSHTISIKLDHHLHHRDVPKFVHGMKKKSIGIYFSITYFVGHQCLPVVPWLSYPAATRWVPKGIAPMFFSCLIWPHRCLVLNRWS